MHQWSRECSGKGISTNLPTPLSDILCALLFCLPISSKESWQFAACFDNVQPPREHHLERWSVDEEEEWHPSFDHLRSVLGMMAALARGDAGAIRALTRDMTLHQGAMSCFALGQFLIQRLAELSGKSLEDVVAQLSLEIGQPPPSSTPC